MRPSIIKNLSYVPRPNQVVPIETGKRINRTTIQTFDDDFGDVTIAGLTKSDSSRIP